MAEAVYLLCAATSVACAVLLWRGWRRSGTRLLWWTALCFIGLAVNNVVLLADETVLRDVWDLRWLRTGTGFVAVVTLLAGLIWETGAER